MTQEKLEPTTVPVNGNPLPTTPPTPGPSRAAYHLAAALLLLHVLQGLLRLFFFTPQPDLWVIIIELPLAIGLWRVSKWARRATLIWASIVVILAAISLLDQISPALIFNVPIFGVIILLLTGQTRPWRISLARTILILMIVVTVFFALPTVLMTLKNRM